MLLFLAVAAARADEEINTLFGMVLPENTLLVAVDEGDGSFTVYALDTDGEWLEPNEQETWPAYVERVSTVQGMPTGVWFPDELVVDEVANTLSLLYPLDPVLRQNHRVGYGYFDNGAEQILTVFDFHEVIRTDGYPGVPEELLTVRTAYPVGFPIDDEETQELVDLALLPVLPPGGGDGDDAFCSDGSLRPYARVGCQPRAQGRTGRTGPPRYADGKYNNDARSLANPAGLLCLAEDAQRRQACDSSFVSLITSCESTYQSNLLTLASVCTGILALVSRTGNILLFAGAAGACLVPKLIIEHQYQKCVRDARKVRRQCHSASKSLFDACCAQPGTDCDIPILLEP